MLAPHWKVIFSEIFPFIAPSSEESAPIGKFLAPLLDPSSESKNYTIPLSQITGDESESEQALHMLTGLIDG